MNISKYAISTAYMLGVVCLLASAPVFAQSAGVNSTSGDLPIGANGKAEMFMGGGGKVPQGDITFGADTVGNSTMWVDTTAGNLYIPSGSVVVGGATANQQTVVTANNLKNLGSCGASQMLTKNADGSFSCVGPSVTEGLYTTASADASNNYHQTTYATSARAHAFCYLTANQVDGDADNNCSVYPQNGVWVLEADTGIVGDPPGGRVNCAASCIDFK